METLSDIGLSDVEAAQTHDKWNTYSTVVEALQREGFHPLAMPSVERPQYLSLDELSTKDSRVLIGLFHAHESWRSYCGERNTYIRMLLVQVRNQMANIEAATKKTLRAGRTGTKAITREELAEASRTNPHYEELKRNEQQYLQTQIYYDEAIEHHERNAKLVSRVITLRGQDIEGNGRGGSLGTPGDGRYPPQL